MGMANSASSLAVLVLAPGPSFADLDRSSYFLSAWMLLCDGLCPDVRALQLLSPFRSLFLRHGRPLHRWVRWLKKKSASVATLTCVIRRALQMQYHDILAMS